MSLSETAIACLERRISALDQNQQLIAAECHLNNNTSEDQTDEDQEHMYTKRRATPLPCCTLLTGPPTSGKVSFKNLVLNK